MNLFAKVAADLDSNPKIRMLRAICGNDNVARSARAIFEFVLRRNALLGATGRVPVVNVEPWYLYDQIWIPMDEAVPALSACIRCKLLAIDDNEVWIVGWNDEWARRPLTEAERQSNRRAKTKPATRPQLELVSVPEQPNVNVTISHDAIVTRHDPDVTCPDSHASDQIREEEEEEGEHARPRARSPTPTPLPYGWMPEPSVENMHASLEAERRGVVVSYALTGFREKIPSRGELSCNWDARWRSWLNTELPTPPKIRDAVVRIDREVSARAARDRERAQLFEQSQCAESDREEVRRLAQEAITSGFRLSTEKGTAN